MVSDRDVSGATWVAGVDGCRAGWLVVLLPLAPRVMPHVRLAGRFEEVLSLAEAPCRIAVDIPIGLPVVGERGGRACDREARSRLGARQSSVFAVPSRAAVMEGDYARASAVALATSDPPRKVSKQCFNLFAKIREVDALLTPERQGWIVECHPEAAFWAMAGGTPLSEPKKVTSRPYEPGLALRRGLLRAVGIETSEMVGLADLPIGGVGPDDILDAAACAWTARRLLAGVAQCFPVRPPIDARGLRMEIWA